MAYWDYSHIHAEFGPRPGDRNSEALRLPQHTHAPQDDTLIVGDGIELRRMGPDDVFEVEPRRHPHLKVKVVA